MDSEHDNEIETSSDEGRNEEYNDISFESEECLELEIDPKDTEGVEELLSPTEDISAEDLRIIDSAIVHCIMKDTIQGVYTAHPDIRKGSIVDARLKQLWAVYKNTRLYRGDFLGLRLSFREKIEDEQQLNTMIRMYDEQSKNRNKRLSLNKFFLLHQHEIPLGRTAFQNKVNLYAASGQPQRLSNRGSVSLLTLEMEKELCAWIYRCNHRGGAPSGYDIRAMALFLCRANEQHWERVRVDHQALHLDKADMLSKNWFRNFLRRGNAMKPPLKIASKRAQKSEEGRLQITRPMIDSLYTLLTTVFERLGGSVKPSNIWNFDESALKMEYHRKFCYGIKGAAWATGESLGSAKHVTVGIFVNMIGKRFGVDYFPTFLTSGNKLIEGRFKNATNHYFGRFAFAQVKQGKASMDDVLFTELIQIISFNGPGIR
jgi:hypothetical protein